MKTKFFILLTIILLLTSGCVTQSRNLEISSVTLIPGEEVKAGVYKESTGHYWPSELTFVITNIGSNTDPGHYLVYARIYDKSGNFVAKSTGDVGFTLEPRESRTVRLFFSNLDWTKNVNFNDISLGKIDLIFDYYNDEGKSTEQFIYTKNY